MKHTITFDLHQTRLEFIIIGLKLIWAGIIGAEAVWFKNIGCDSITSDGKIVDYDETEDVESVECSGGCGKWDEPNYEGDRFYCGGSPYCCP